MPTVRRKNSLNTAGYGVAGNSFEQPLESVEFNLGDLCTEIGACQVFDGEVGEYVSAYATYQKIYWKASIQNSILDYKRTDTYHVPSEKRRYGRYVMYAEQYATAEGFHSYDAEMFKNGRCVNLFVDGSPSDEVPCDQPNAELGLPPILLSGDLVIFPYSLEQPLNNLYQAVNVDIIGADRIRYFPEPYLLGFTLGVTYIYYSFGFTEAEWLSQGLPPILLF